MVSKHVMLNFCLPLPCPSATAPSFTEFPKCSTPRCNLYDNFPKEQLNSLRAQLAAAVSAQDFSRAAKLRDEISSLESTASDELAVTLANEAFYDALRRSDPEVMSAVWLPSDTVSCAQTIAGFVYGFENVIASWRRVFTAGRPTEVEVQEVNVSVRRNVAWVICRQIITTVRGSISLGGERIATNIFQKKHGKWLMVHHHASPLSIPDGQQQQPPPPPPPPPMTA